MNDDRPVSLCVNPAERYAIVWNGKHYGPYYWITPASLCRLLTLTSNPQWRQTVIAGDEVMYTRV